MRVLNAVLLSLVAAGAALAATGSLVYFPVAAGNSWEYRDASGQTMKIDVRIPEMHNGNAYNRVYGYAAEPVLLRNGEDGNLYRFDEEAQREVLFASFEPVDGGWYDTSIPPCEQMAQPQQKPVIYRSPAGGEIPTLQVLYRNISCADAGLTEELYAANIGLVRRTVTTFVGPRTFELVHARVGALAYSARPGSAFSVLLDRNYFEPAVGETPKVNVTMRVSLRNSPAHTLRFASGQRYDIQLRDPKGVVIWKWSDDVAFPQAVQDSVVIRDAEWTQQIPLEARGGMPLEGGYYTVEAWLNTEGREFAGAARVWVAPRE